LFNLFSDLISIIGANLGVQARKLYEHKRFKKGSLSMLFDDLFGLQNRENVCTFAFEPNPRHQPRLREMEAVYNSLDLRYHYFPVAVSTINTNLLLGRPNSEGQAAASLVKDGVKTDKHTISVKVIDFPSFFREHILKSTFFDSMTKRPRGKILCKMDIEGEEFNLLPNLIQSGDICYIDTMTTEFHRTVSLKNHLVGGFLKKSATDKTLEEFQQNLQLIATNYTPGCKTTFLHLDDESYSNDNFTKRALPLYRGAPPSCRNPEQRCVLSSPLPGMSEEEYRDAVYGTKLWT
jgi:hypothetical protein